MTRRRTTASLTTATLLLAATAAQAPTPALAPSATPTPSPAAPPRPGFGRDGTVLDPNWFPIGVWLQQPANAAKYRELGVTLYVGLWEGPTKAQLQDLAAASMPVICHRNEVGAADQSGIILAWMHNDEPDNARGRRFFGQQPPIAPAQVVADYAALRQQDPRRPVFLNLGQGAAWDGWHGRADRNGHPEDYPEYLRGCDIGSFDIYPVTHPHRDVRGKLEFVARGVQRLRFWTDGTKPVWACIETGHVDNAEVRPTPQQVRDEAWLAIAAGASGLIWFCHEFRPQFVEAGLLAHADVQGAVRTVAAELRALAPVLNSKRCDDKVEVQVDGKESEHVAVRVHEHGGELHVIVAALSPEPLAATVQVRGVQQGSVRIADGSQVPMPGGRFVVPLPGYGTRHCRVTVR